MGASSAESLSGKCTRHSAQPTLSSARPQLPLILIAHVASGLRAHSINRGISHLSRVGSGVDWALLPHNEQHVQALQPLVRCGNHRGRACADADALDATSVVVVPPPTQTDSSSMRFRPKLLFQLAAPALARRRQREYVWLADDDISFQGLDLRALFDLHRAVGSPLIAAPLIAPSKFGGRVTQSSELLSNSAQWAPALRRVLAWESGMGDEGVRMGGTGVAALRARAVPSAMIEQQASLLDAAFFEWLAGASSGSRGFALRELAELQDAAGSDWGLDMLWCGAARAYAFETAAGLDALRTPCALLLGVAIDHLDNRTIAKQDWTSPVTGENLSFFDRGVYVQTLIWQTVRGHDEIEHESQIAANLTWPLPAAADAVFRRFAMEQLRLCMPSGHESAVVRALGILHNNPWLPTRLSRKPCSCPFVSRPERCIQPQQQQEARK